MPISRNELAILAAKVQDLLPEDVKFIIAIAYDDGEAARVHQLTNIDLRSREFYTKLLMDAATQFSFCRPTDVVKAAKS